MAPSCSRWPSSTWRLGWYFVRREGERHLYGLLALGTGIATLGMATAVQFSGPLVPMGWTVEGAALAWVAANRRHPYALGSAAILLLAAGLHLSLTEFRARSGFEAAPLASAIVANVMALGFFLAGLGLAVAVVPVRRIRSWAIALGLVVTARAIGTELSGVGAIAAWSLLTVLGVAAWRVLREVPDRPIDWQLDGLVPVETRPGALIGSLSDLAVPAAAAVAGGLAVLAAVSGDLPLRLFGSVRPPAVPFSDEGALVGAILIVAALACGVVAGRQPARRYAILGAGAIAAYVIPYEAFAPGVVELWSALAVLAFFVGTRDADGRRLFLGAGGALLAAAAVIALGIVAPLTRLVVGSQRIEHLFLVSDASAALGAIALALGALAWLYRREPWAQWVEVGVGVVLVYLVSVGVVDVFAGRVGGGLGLRRSAEAGAGRTERPVVGTRGDRLRRGIAGSAARPARGRSRAARPGDSQGVRGRPVRP